MGMREDIRNLVNATLKPLRNRVYNIIARAVLDAVDDSGNMQVIKVGVLAGEDRDDVENFQEYGFTSVALPGAEALIVCPQGNREHMIAVKIGDRTVRLKGLKKGEVAMYTDEGDKIHLKRGGIIEIIGANEVNIETINATVKASIKAKVDAPLVEIGDSGLESILNGETFQTTYNSHVHVGNLGVGTGPPIVPSSPADLSLKVKAAK